MRKLVLVLTILFLAAARCGAKVSISPVIMTAEEVQKGQVFKFHCSSDTEATVAVELSLALFDQDSAGRVVFLEDEGSVQKAAGLLALNKDEFYLEPYGEETIEVSVLADLPKSLSAVLFVKADQPGIPTRLAVLLLLSSKGTEDQVIMTSWRRGEESVAVRLENKGDKAGLWRGHLLLYNSLGSLAARIDLESGLVLAGRSRDFKVNLPAWASRVELQPKEAGLSL